MSPATWRWRKGDRGGDNMPQVCFVSSAHSITGLCMTCRSKSTCPIDWIADHLKGFSGVINVETIDRWPDYRMSPPHVDLAVA